MLFMTDSLRGLMTLLVDDFADEYPNELNDRGADRDNEKPGKQAEHQRKHQLHADLGGTLLGSLPPLRARGVGVRAERLRHARAEAIGLNQHRHQRTHIVYTGTIAEVLEHF